MSLFALSAITAAIRNQVYAPTWTPADLFSNNEQGAWYDPSDLSTLFQDAAGTVPVTEAGQPVGRMVDKSGNDQDAVIMSGDSLPILRLESGFYYLELTARSRMVVSGSESSFSFLHNGSGATSIFSVSFGQSLNPGSLLTIYDSHSLTNAKIGASLFFEDRSGQMNNGLRSILSRGEGNAVGQTLTSVNAPESVIPMTPTNVSLTFEDDPASANDAILYVNSIIAGTGQIDAPPVPTNSGNPLTLFGLYDQTGNLFFLGRYFGSVFVDRVLSSSERVGVESFLATKSGIG